MRGRIDGWRHSGDSLVAVTGSSPGIELGGALQPPVRSLEIVADVEVFATHKTYPGATFAKGHKVCDVLRSDIVGAKGHIEFYGI
jgi:hypothetical protein